jgi:hypothetical protein
VLTNPEGSSQPADISQSPPAAADGGDSPSQLLGAFMNYLRAQPTSGDSESTGFDDGWSELEGVTRGISELGDVPAITLQPQVGRPDRTVLYFHGGGYVSGSPPERYLRWPPRWLWPPMPECTWWTIGSLQKPPSLAPSTTAFTPITGLSHTAARNRKGWPYSAIRPAVT